MPESYITITCIKCGRKEFIQDPDCAGTYYAHGYTRVCCGMDMVPASYSEDGGASGFALRVLKERGRVYDSIICEETDMDDPDIWDYYQDREGA